MVRTKNKPFDEKIAILDEMSNFTNRKEFKQYLHEIVYQKNKMLYSAQTAFVLVEELDLINDEEMRKMFIQALKRLNMGMEFVNHLQKTLTKIAFKEDVEEGPIDPFNFLE